MIFILEHNGKNQSSKVTIFLKCIGSTYRHLRVGCGPEPATKTGANTIFDGFEHKNFSFEKGSGPNLRTFGLGTKIPAAFGRYIVLSFYPIFQLSPTGGQTDGCTDGRTDGQTDVRTDVQTDGQTDNLLRKVNESFLKKSIM
jgi:hypothetical protein